MISEINGFITTSNSNLNTSGEFVTVKGKRNKTNKKEAVSTTKPVTAIIKLNKPILKTNPQQKIAQPKPIITIKPKETVTIPIKSSFSAPIIPTKMEPINDFVNDINNTIFPPLLSTNSKPFTQIVSETKPIALKIEQEQTLKPQPTTKPAKKNKLEFLTQRNNNSVIFLDELKSNHLNSKQKQDSSDLLQQNDKNVLNGIKFGFIDSSSSDEEPLTAQIKAEPIKERNKKKINSTKLIKQSNSASDTTSTDNESDSQRIKQKIKTKNKKLNKLKEKKQQLNQSSDESLSNNDKTVNKPVILNTDLTTTTTTTSHSSITVPVAANAAVLLNTNYQQAAAAPFMFYPNANQMNAYLAACYGYPQLVTQPNGSQFMMPPFVPQQFYQQVPAANYYYNNKQTEVKNEQSSTNSSNNSTPTPAQNEPIQQSAAEAQHFSNTAPVAAAGYPPFMQSGPFYSYPVPMDYIPTAVNQSVNDLQPQTQANQSMPLNTSSNDKTDTRNKRNNNNNNRSQRNHHSQYQHNYYQQHQNELYSNRMPLYYPNQQNHQMMQNPTIIADALQVAYTADYKGDFNLDEAAYYIAKQWNNMKLNDNK